MRCGIFGFHADSPSGLASSSSDNDLVMDRSVCWCVNLIRWSLCASFTSSRQQWVFESLWAMMNPRCAEQGRVWAPCCIINESTAGSIYSNSGGKGARLCEWEVIYEIQSVLPACEDIRRCEFPQGGLCWMGNWPTDLGDLLAPCAQSHNLTHKNTFRLAVCVKYRTVYRTSLPSGGVSSEGGEQREEVLQMIGSRSYRRSRRRSVQAAEGGRGARTEGPIEVVWCEAVLIGLHCLD